MPTVTVEGEKSFEAEAGKKLVLAIEDAGIDILHRCGGNARCTTCRVQVVSGDPGPMSELERDRLAREASLGPDIRLSCQIRVESDLTINVVNRAAALRRAGRRVRGLRIDRRTKVRPGSRKRDPSHPPRKERCQQGTRSTEGMEQDTTTSGFQSTSLQREMAADLTAAPFAAMVLVLSHLLFAGSVRHGSPLRL